MFVQGKKDVMGHNSGDEEIEPNPSEVEDTIGKAKPKLKRNLSRNSEAPLNYKMIMLFEIYLICCFRYYSMLFLSLPIYMVFIMNKVENFLGDICGWGGFSPSLEEKGGVLILNSIIAVSVSIYNIYFLPIREVLYVYIHGYEFFLESLVVIIKGTIPIAFSINTCSTSPWKSTSPFF